MKTIDAKLIFLATADLKFEVPDDVPDDKLEEVLAAQLAATDPIEKLVGSTDVEYVRWVGLQSENPPIAIMPQPEDALLDGDLEDEEDEEDDAEDEDEEDLNKLLVDDEAAVSAN